MTSHTSSRISVISTLSRSESISLISLSVVSLTVIAHGLHYHSEPLIASLAFSTMAFTVSYAMIRWLGPTFIKAGLKGVDMSKTNKKEIPETMGAVCAVVYLLIIIIFIPFSFYKDFVAAATTISAISPNDLSVTGIELDIVHTGRILHKFPHRKVSSFQFL